MIPYLYFPTIFFIHLYLSLLMRDIPSECDTTTILHISVIVAFFSKCNVWHVRQNFVLKQYGNYYNIIAKGCSV